MGLLDEKKIKEVQEYMKNASASFDDGLLQLNIISDEQLGITVANYLKIPFVNLSKVSIPQDVFHIVPEKIARKHKVIAFGRDQNGTKVAMADPKNNEIIALIAQKTESKVIPYLATPRDINNTFYIFKKDCFYSAFFCIRPAANPKSIFSSAEPAFPISNRNALS